MHGRFEKPRKNDNDLHEDGGFKFLMASVLIVVVLIVCAVIHPKSSTWISQAVEAEYGGLDTPKQPAPASPVRTVRTQ